MQDSNIEAKQSRRIIIAETIPPAEIQAIKNRLAHVSEYRLQGTVSIKVGRESQNSKELIF
jgi:hypothetical protein